MRSFNQIYQEIKQNYPNLTQKEQTIKAREIYYFEN